MAALNPPFLRARRSPARDGGHGARDLLAAALLAAIALTAACAEKPAPEASDAEIQRALTPRERGERRARSDLAAGKARVYEFGSPLSSLGSRRDPTSGLPVRTLIDCCVSAELREETDAYNRVMREAVAATGGLKGAPPAR